MQFFILTVFIISKEKYKGENKYVKPETRF